MTRYEDRPDLGLWPDTVTVAHLLDDTPSDLARQLVVARQDLAHLRDALAEAVEAAATGTYPGGPKVRAWRALAGIPAHDAGQTPEERRDDGIARAAAKWTDEEVAAVDAAIRAVTERKLAEARRLLAPSYVDDLIAAPHISDRLLEFTTADVWVHLGPGFPVTKGIAGRMLAAKGAGLIANTGRTVIAPRDATGPNHGQRLTVWRAL